MITHEKMKKITKSRINDPINKYLIHASGFGEGN
jgi:hypothetical protein